MKNYVHCTQIQKVIQMTTFFYNETNKKNTTVHITVYPT